MNLSENKKPLATCRLCSERKKQNKTYHVESKFDSSKLTCTKVLVGAGENVKNGNAGKDRTQVCHLSCVYPLYSAVVKR